MSELTDLVAIYGAIDHAVKADPDRRAAASQLLPVYKDPEAEWFDELEAWIAERAPEGVAQPFPSLEEALRRLGNTPAHGRMRARRLFAVGVGTQAFPELLEHPHWSNLAVSALTVEGLAPDEDHARRLLTRLGEGIRTVRGAAPEAVESGEALDAWWERLQGEDLPELVPAAEDIGHRPCRGRIVRGPMGSAAAIETYFTTDKVEFDRAIRFLDPVTWRECSGFWCEMEPLGEVAPGIKRYHEVVSLDCGRRRHTWTIEAILDFAFRKDDSRAVTEYQMSPGVEQPDVIVDEGSLLVERIDPDDSKRLAVTTTKRIRFAGILNGEPLAMVMCLVGYASVAEDLFECAAAGAEGVDFPEKEVVTTSTGGGAGPPRAPGTVRRRPSPKPLIDDIADRAANAFRDCLEENVSAAQESYEAIVERRYTANHMVQDMANMWVRMLRDGATAVDLAVRSAQMAPRTGPRRPPQK